LYKRRGLFSKRRVFLLTQKPRLLYLDEEKSMQKGEVPLSAEVKVEMKSKKIFYVHTVRFWILFFFFFLGWTTGFRAGMRALTMDKQLNIR
jgi:hypothetical protein